MKVGCMLGESRGKINHLLFMDDLKVYGETMKELDSLMQRVRIFNSDIGMQYEISKCATLEMKKGKIVQTDGIELPSGETIKSLEHEKGYKYLGVLHFESVKSKLMKDMITKEYYQRIRKTLKASLNAENTIQTIHAKAILVIRYGAIIVKWRKNKLEAVDRKTRELSSNL